MKTTAMGMVFVLALAAASAAQADMLRVKDIARFEGWRENQLVGYGVVTGLAGTGDSPRNAATRQSLANMLKQFDVSLTSDQIQSRNVAIVMVTADLPPFGRVGDRIDVTVTSAGDARSLVGGSLLLAPIKGADNQIHVLAQGAISVGGYKYDFNGNVTQKNHPTVGRIPGGGIIEIPVDTRVLHTPNSVLVKLNEPDYTTASRVARSINLAQGRSIAAARDAGAIEVTVPGDQSARFVDFLTAVENTRVDPDTRPRVVVNERTGTVVAGADVRISRVTIAHGDLKLSIVTENTVSQPTFVEETGIGVRTVVVPNTRIEVTEGHDAVISESGTTVGDLVRALNRVKTRTRDIIAILQSVKAAGALHADLIIQ
jgi:flagellar P-ring protein FlgI